MAVSTDHKPPSSALSNAAPYGFGLYCKAKHRWVQRAHRINGADAAFIVTACNNHDALVAALREIERMPYSLDDAERCTIGRIARAALQAVQS